MTHVPDTEVEVFDDPGEVYVEDLSIGETSPKIRVFDIKETDFVRYAGASGDFNPLHYDMEFVKERGYDNVFAMGMLNAGFLTHLVTKWLGLSTISYFKTQFKSIVWVGDDLELYAEVREKDPEDGSILCDLYVENQDSEVVVSGEVRASLPSRNETV